CPGHARNGNGGPAPTEAALAWWSAAGAPAVGRPRGPVLVDRPGHGEPLCPPCAARRSDPGAGAHFPRLLRRPHAQIVLGTLRLDGHAPVLRRPACHCGDPRRAPRVGGGLPDADVGPPWTGELPAGPCGLPG